MKKIFLIAIIITVIIIGLYIFFYPYLPVRSCPDTDHIDCMPFVSHFERRYCNLENKKWIQEHCPNILYTY